MVHRLAADDRRVAGVRHDDHGRAVGFERAQELQQMVRSRAAVEARDVDLGDRAGAVIQRLTEDAVARDAVIAHGIGDDDERLRAAAFHMPRELRDAVVGAQRLDEKMRDALVEEQLRLPDVALGGAERAAVRRRADVAEDECAELRRRVFRKLAAGAEHGLSRDGVGKGEVLAQTVGVRLERHRARLQIRAVDAQHLGGVQEVRLLAAHLLALGQRGVVGAHRAVEEKGPALGEQRADIHLFFVHPSTSFAISTACRASLA